MATKKQKPWRSDNTQTKALKTASRAASREARKDTRQRDLPITFVENGVIKKELPSGKTVKVGPVARHASQDSKVLIKGTILRAK